MWTFKKRVPEIQAQTLSTYTLFAKPVSKNENVHDSVPFVHQLIGYQTSPDPSRNSRKIFSNTTETTLLQCFNFYRHASQTRSHNSYVLYSYHNGLRHNEAVSISGSSRDQIIHVQWVQETSHWQ